MLTRCVLDQGRFECWTCGSECDGAGARFVRASAGKMFRVESGWMESAVVCRASIVLRRINGMSRWGVGGRDGT